MVICERARDFKMTKFGSISKQFCFKDTNQNLFFPYTKKLKLESINDLEVIDFFLFPTT